MKEKHILSLTTAVTVLMEREIAKSKLATKKETGHYIQTAFILVLSMA